jgi:long-chain alkane monooxygenase
MTRCLRFNAFTMNCVSHIVHGFWDTPETAQRDYASLRPWVELARLLERGKFDAMFLADVIGVYDSYRGSRDVSVAEGMQIPVNDPAMLIPAMSWETSNLGFAFTHSVLQEHPFNFARRASTLDHLTGGRVAWNIVTSYLENAGRNLGYGGLPPHAERYQRAEEYAEVVYKLWEGSWEDDAVLRDGQRRIYADPAKVHDINHEGRYYDVVGPHLCEPSPQRTPVLYQAGSSEDGRTFCARHAEATFIAALNPAGAAALTADIRRRAALAGRQADDVLCFQGLSFVVGSTEAEAASQAAAITERMSTEGILAHMSGSLGVDLSRYDPAEPIGDLYSNGIQGFLKGLIEAAPDKTWTFGDMMKWVALTRLVGTPEQIADGLEQWAAAGVDGINVIYVTTPGSFTDFIEHVVPVLQARGLMQRDYAPGTLREKLFPGRGARLNDRHPAAAHRPRSYRAAPAAVSAVS